LYEYVPANNSWLTLDDDGPSFFDAPASDYIPSLDALVLVGSDVGAKSPIKIVLYFFGKILNFFLTSAKAILHG
jgi:hypothetical protein